MERFLSLVRKLQNKSSHFAQCPRGGSGTPRSAVREGLRGLRVGATVPHKMLLGLRQAVPEGKSPQSHSSWFPVQLRKSYHLLCPDPICPPFLNP